MSRKVEIGAPSLTGRGADLVVAAFAGAVYPVSVMMTNHTPIEFSLPEAGGVFLRSVLFGGNDQNKQRTIFHNEAQFSRLASSIEQICELNGFHYVAITIEEIGANEPELPADLNSDLDQGGGGDNDDDGKSGGDGDADKEKQGGSSDADSNPGTTDTTGNQGGSNDANANGDANPPDVGASNDANKQPADAPQSPAAGNERRNKRANKQKDS